MENRLSVEKQKNIHKGNFFKYNTLRCYITVALLGSCYVHNWILQKLLTSKIFHFQILLLQKYVASLKLLHMRRTFGRGGYGLQATAADVGINFGSITWHQSVYEPIKKESTQNETQKANKHESYPLSKSGRCEFLDYSATA